MMKNEYRRALILLRATQPGVNGHVRLERRTLMGSMQFTVSGLNTAQPLQAAMAANTAAGWKITHIGTLGRDSRGQAGLNWTFDPRSIEGLPLEKYSVLLVLETGEDGCRALLTGYVNGSVQVDWERVEQAACASYMGTAPDTNAADMEPSPDVQDMQTEPVAPAETDMDSPAEAVDETAPVETDDLDAPADPNAQLPGTTPIFRDPEAECELDVPAMSGNVDLDVPAMDSTEIAAPAMAAADAQPAKPAAAVYMDPLDVPARAAETALDALGMEAGQRWPEGIEPLREAFAASAPVFLNAQPDHVFVKMAHSAQCPECAVGVHAEDGAPVSVAYAIPGEFSAQPPAGLEGYAWRDGWWIAVADAQTGAYLHI